MAVAFFVIVRIVLSLWHLEPWNSLLMHNKITLKKYGQDLEFLNDRDKMKRMQ